MYAGFFGVLCILMAEIWMQRRQKKALYNVADTITNVSCGMSDRLFSLFFDGVQYVIWSAIGNRFGIFAIPGGWLGVVLCLLVTDFVWYWYHRLGHEVRFLWAVHSLHHQSENYNISVGFRISIFQYIVRTCFWIALPILGFSADVIVLVLVGHALYQLLLHTQVVPKLGFLEKIIVTPSTHRVHHGVNDRYLDKNYGGMFVIWDRLFGTYEPETEEVKYGITDQTGNMTILEAHTYGFKQLMLPLKLGQRIEDAVAFFFSKPKDVPDYMVGKTKIPAKQFQPIDNQQNYVLAQIVLCALGLFYMIFWSRGWEMSLKSTCAIFVCWGILSASLQWRRYWVLYFFQEGVRIVLWGLFFYTLGKTGSIPILSSATMIGLTIVVAVLYLKKVKKIGGRA
jgi:sterol desaturase/sphingolipid hydroxylase (fatty acid hydroxylase superfamily)